MNTNPELSVVVPCHNAQLTVRRSIESLLDQEEGAPEVICVDDGSTDATPDVLQTLAREHPGRVRVITQANQGPWYARRTGTSLANGRYVGYLDADDTVAPTYASRMLRAAHEADADVVVCGFRRIEEASGRTRGEDLTTPRTSFTIQDDPGRTVEVNPAPWNKIYRAELIKRMPDLRPAPLIMEDLAMQLLLYPRLRGGVSFVPETLVDYHVHEGSLMTGITWERAAPALAALRAVGAAYDRWGVSKGLREAFDTICFLHVGVSLTYRLSLGNELPLRDILGRITAFLDEVAPTWRRSPYLQESYVRSHGASYRRLRLAWQAYRLGLMEPFLAAYSFVTEHFIDVKW